MKTILLVDDEIDVREFAKNYFKKRGINVITAAGGKEALTILESHQPQLLLLDVRMEDMTGIDLLRKIRERGDNVKVIMVTGVEDADTVAAAENLGVTAYIHKPLVLEELERIVMSGLNENA